ncbi:uncharacterized protein LOC143299675 [Babylonia areolata]|uniref:uncharacterized protein LOC143299675 n=1 Tax=Babylonia areolata TaxID=304850 RepID=UPI003FD26A02
MDADMATRFIASLTKSLQAVIHGCLDFDKDIELGGYVYLKVDNAERIDYVLNEKMQKSDLNSMTFHSNSFHALPQAGSDGSKSSKDKNISASSTESAGKSAGSGRVHSRSETESPMYSSSHGTKMSHQNLPHSHTQNSDSFMHPKSTCSNEFQMATGSVKMQSSNNKNTTVTSPEGFKSNNRSLTDFQTAFRNPSAALGSQLPQSTSAHSWAPSHNGSNSRPSASHTVQQQQQNKSGILPDPSDMEVVHVKTEEEDDVFNIPLQCHQAGSESDGFAAQGKAPWLAMRMRQPFYFPYPRLARSQSFDQRMSMARSNPRFPFFSGESSSETTSLTCKVCGKGYRSRQGLLFHERAKHQNVFNVYCPVCGKGFQQTTHMYGHMATHTNIKNFQCQACGAKYAHKTSLQQHLRSGSCRAAQMNSSAGLDLSAPQLLREFTPYSLNEMQPSSSSSHSQSQSPLENANSSLGHAEGDMGLNDRRLSSFGLSNQLDSDLEDCERQDPSSDKTATENMSREMSGDSFNLTDDDHVGQGMSGYGSQPREVNMLGAQDCRGAVFPSRGDSRELMGGSGEVARGLNLISRNDVRGSAATAGSESPQTVGVDMTKDTQVCDNAGSAASVCDDRQEAVYEHDSDVPETVSLSLSADDD